MRRLMLAACVLAGGCVSDPSGERPAATDHGQLEHAPMLVCGEPSRRTIALLSPANRDACSFALELGDDEQLRVRPLARSNPLIEAEAIASGPGPEPCGAQLQTCELHGIIDEQLGPIVIAAQRGPESEIPVQVFVGWLTGDELAFVETWYGPPSVSDHTRIGPAWALAPFDCDGALLLLPAPRLPEAAHEQPPQALIPLAGRWQLGAERLVYPPAEPSTRDPSSCRALDLALP